jgi:hypothetical protein
MTTYLSDRDQYRSAYLFGALEAMVQTLTDEDESEIHARLAKVARALIRIHQPGLTPEAAEGTAEADSFRA